VSRVALESAALRYLERFDCSVARLRKVLGERVTQAARAGVADADQAPAVVEELLARYQASGLIDDHRFAKNFADGQRLRGASRRVIEQKLRQRGIPRQIVQELLPQRESADNELAAAHAFAKRRRLGPHRKPETRGDHQRKDLLAMARAGFDYETAQRVLGKAFSQDEA
jgi:regulatory protein